MFEQAYYALPLQMNYVIILQFWIRHVAKLIGAFVEENRKQRKNSICANTYDGKHA